MEPSSTWEANSCSSTQRKFQHCIEPVTCLYPVPDEYNPYLPTYFSKIHYNIFLSSTSRYSSWPFSITFAYWSPVRTPIPCVLLVLPSLTWSFCLYLATNASYEFPKPPIISSILDPNIFHLLIAGPCIFVLRFHSPVWLWKENFLLRYFLGWVYPFDGVTNSTASLLCVNQTSNFVLYLAYSLENNKFFNANS